MAFVDEPSTEFQAVHRVFIQQFPITDCNGFITDELKVKIATCTHDEIVLALSADERKYADQILLVCTKIMETPPAWLPDLPLKVEGGVSERYEK